MAKPRERAANILNSSITTPAASSLPFITTTCFFFFMMMIIGSSKGNEANTLLSFKSLILDPHHYLSDWKDPNTTSSTALCSWSGITCTATNHVREISLSGKNISSAAGTQLLPSSIFRLPYIESIDLSDNMNLSGIIPPEAFSSSTLRYLNLSGNNLTGTIPGRVRRPGGMSGAAGTSQPHPRLETLDLSNNMIAGEIPENIGGMFPNLRYLDLGGNLLVGKIPSSITKLTKLEYLTLASNQLIGEVPSGLGRKMKRLTLLYLGYNNLSGSIPEEFGQLTSLYHLDLVYNNFTGRIPSSLGNLTRLQYLYLYQNKLTGHMPTSIFSIKSLVSLDLSDNLLTGEIPAETIDQLQNLEVLHLFSNNLTGKIPDSISSLPRLQVLQLWSNNLTGHIPQDLGKRNNLTVLDLSTNELTGNIPPFLCNSNQLYKLILFSNSLEGNIPSSLSGCRSLRRVRLQNNRISGAFPSGFFNLPALNFLDVSGNNLSGDISSGGRYWSMPSLQMIKLSDNGISGDLPDLSSGNLSQLEKLDLSGNYFSGSIRPGYGQLSGLMELNLSNNAVSGRIPHELSSCQKLVSLDLSHNQLTGSIPSSLAELPVLGQLDLSVNKLSGEIPSKLGEVGSLVQVNVSYNDLHGLLPSSGAFVAINATAVAGNHLCSGSGGDRGTTAGSGLPPCKGNGTDDDVKRSLVLWCIAGSCAAVIISLALLGYLALFVQRRRKRNVSLKLEKYGNEEDGGAQGGVWEVNFFDSKASKSISMEDILLSVGDDKNVVSRDKSGRLVLFKGRSCSSDMEFMVETINVGHGILGSCSWVEVVKFGRSKLRHPNVVKLLGNCKSEKHGILIYEYVHGAKNLSDVLHGSNNNNNKNLISWERRRKIAVGIARALKFLHSRMIVVGDLSLDKVLVDGRDEPRLRLNIPGLLCTDPKCFTASPYVAPETGATKEITDKNDMYGYGLILIGLLTGKSPADAGFGAHDSIVDWARYCYSDCHLDTWVDPKIRGQRWGSNGSKESDEIVEAMNLAIRCTAPEPSARPCSSDAVRSLESVMRIKSCVLGFEVSSRS